MHFCRYAVYIRFLCIKMAKMHVDNINHVCLFIFLLPDIIPMFFGLKLGSRDIK